METLDPFADQPDVVVETFDIPGARVTRNSRGFDVTLLGFPTVVFHGDTVTEACEAARAAQVEAEKGSKKG